MPRYEYHCKNCNKNSLIRHGIKEKVTICPVCHKEGQLERIPSFSGNYKIKDKKTQAGSVVKKYIEKAKEQLKEEKKDLKNRKYGE
tara:strand:+ start:573 stop:830 length:258 start_codon:yes stop_codon:yes gene_type:complete